VKAHFRAAKAAILLGDVPKAREHFAAVRGNKDGAVEEDELAEDLRTLDSIERLKDDLAACMAEEKWTEALDVVKDLRFLCPCEDNLGLVRAEILAMMGTFEESNRIVNDIKVGRRKRFTPQYLYALLRI
jgi:hypothetical protein